MRRRFTVLAATAALLLVGGVAVASIPDASGVIHGCRKTNGGALSVIDSATQTCPAGTVALNWSQTGPTGPSGPTGPPGVAGVYVVDSAWSSQWGPFETDCTVGDAALSIAIEYVPGNVVQPVSATPVLTAGQPTGYTYFNTSGINGGAQWRVHVTCAQIGA